jgi:uroporphyrinogen III methyltransferase / synthase
MSSAPGKVWLVGAGPGAPDLITLRALRCLQRAEVVLYDELCSPELLAEAPESAEQISVGKRGEHKTMPQEEITRLLVERALQGKRVVRLKGGDPFVLGRGGEEAEGLVAAGVPFEVVPGVTSAVAVPAFAGIPLTHRELAGGFEVWTGHGEEPTPARTAVVLMGMRRLAENVERLRRAGWADDVPAAVVQWGTLPRQRTVVSTLAGIAEAAAGMESPAVLVVGEVVKLRERLSWFERLPLFGVRVLVTRSRQQAAETCRALEELGAEAVVMSTIAIRPPDDPEPLRRAGRELGPYDWGIATSANSVEPLHRALDEAGLDARAFGRARLCAIGPGTAAALAKLGLRPDLVPDDHRAEGILAQLGGEDLAGKRVLIPRAKVARELLPEQLAARGARVEVVVAYQTGHADEADAQPGLRALEAGEVDVLTFTSASTAEGFAAILGDRLPALCAGKLVVAIGPVTRDACEKLGLHVQVMPERYTISGMVQALAEHLRKAH